MTFLLKFYNNLKWLGFFKGNGYSSDITIVCLDLYHGE